MNNDVRRPLTEECRHRVTRWFVGLYCITALVVVVVIAALWFAHGARHVDGGAFVVVPLLYVWGMSSLVVLTFGWIGVYVAPATVWGVIAAAFVIAVMSGFLFMLISVITTPVLFVAGAIVRWIIVAVQKKLGIRLVPTAIASPVAAVS